MKQILDEIEAELPKMTWFRDKEAEKDPSAIEFQGRCYVGTSESWRVALATFSIDGERGADGAATSVTKMMVIRLTPELAKKAADIAAKATP